MSEEEENQISIKSKYDSGIAKEIRRNKLWDEVNKHKREGNYIKWNEDLDCIWCELVADANKKKIFESKKTKFQEFDKDILKIGQIVDNYNKGFKQPDKNDYAKRSKHYAKLMEKEVFLRLLEEELGKGSKWEDENEDDF